MVSIKWPVFLAEQVLSLLLSLRGRTHIEWVHFSAALHSLTGLGGCSADQIPVSCSLTCLSLFSIRLPFCISGLVKSSAHSKLRTYILLLSSSLPALNQTGVMSLVPTRAQERTFPTWFSWIYLRKIEVININLAHVSSESNKLRCPSEFLGFLSLSDIVIW